MIIGINNCFLVNKSESNLMSKGASVVKLTSSLFEDLIGQDVEVFTADGKHKLNELQVDAIDECKLNSNEFEGFSVTLTAKSNFPLTDDTYTLKHQKLGEMPLFLSAYEKDKYQIIISIKKEA
ncbi:hypothetical protein KIJ96_23200 (plasmid) [Pseudoalteromonas piscicida]|uniref:DUF6916 domain-containing protein n=2 Tax=Pseudoalteromonas TaxID=53246 RepID=A0A8I2H3H6_9GAMM|nr:hypothetical protein B1L02_19405 [Pseudoalteromonas piscicida]KID35233.1 hypothetical protein QT15_13305 [Pseudoalteromonas flavipulchra NCIMB 2033 = ATCC BAA-314]MBB1300739.1 hypothetical protein [Pseudoalteromonas sp. SR44-8]MBD0784173.1 hypothetical protein [Pseudoalteromonas flavipulchra]MBR8843401.1 hypothetical protein [Pseudoalteromonas sp. JC3]NLR23727.1 hypothetical protein [Pseudoalteromonas maricaloris]PAY02713.1 hypothetical protein CKO50_03450 [Pseudoalteromonas sp. HM-SA03]P